MKLPIAAFFLKQDAAPDFHSHLILARDGGFSDVPALFTYTKFLGALVSIAMIFVNVYSVLLWDIRRLKFKVTDVTDAADADQMLLTARLMQALAPDAPFPFEVILAACELLCVVHLLGSGVTLLVMILASQCLARWSAASFLLWHVLPALQSFSAMRLLHRISPAVLVADIEDLGEKCGALVRERAGPLRALGSIFYFLIARIMVLVIGFDAFILKLGAAAAHLQPGVPPLLAIGKLGLFLHQVMGIVQVQRFTLARLMLFIFGGEDAKMEPHENATLKVWMALLAKRMWQSFPGRPDRSISVMLTFDDVDFQRLVFSERL